MTVFSTSTVRSSFLGRAVEIAWDALPLALPTVVLTPLLVFGGLVVGTRVPLLGMPVALLAAGALVAWGFAAAIRASIRLGDLQGVHPRSAWIVVGSGALVGSVVGAAVGVMTAAGIASDRGAPLWVTAPAWGIAAGLTIVAGICFPRILLGVATGQRGSDAALEAFVAAFVQPRRTAGCLVISLAVIAAAAVWGPIGLACGLTVWAALVIVTMRSTPQGEQKK